MSAEQLTYRVTIERTPECATAVVKANTTRDEFPTLWRPMLDEVWAFLRARPGLRTDGHNVMLYRSHSPTGGLAVEVGVQVTGMFEPHGRVVPSTLPATEVATTTHTGSVAQLGAAYDAIRRWCSERQRALGATSWEIYGDPDPKTGHFDVTVYWQLDGA